MKAVLSSVPSTSTPSKPAKPENERTAMNGIKTLLLALREQFKIPSAIVIAQREYEEAQRSLLVAQSASEYHLRISAYHSDRIKRLSAYLADAYAKEQEKTNDQAEI